MSTAPQLSVQLSSVDGFLRRRGALPMILAVLIILPAAAVAGRENPSPAALLRGVEAARTKDSSLTATLEISFIVPPPKHTIKCFVEMDGSKRRFEVIGGDVDLQVIIRDGEEFRGFRRKNHEDVQIYDLRRAVGTRGDLAFDPRVLGLNDHMFCHVTVKDCLWYDKNEGLETVGAELLNGVSVWKVRATRRGSNAAVFEYWVEEPSFRVHRKTEEWGSKRIVIDSEFDAAAPHSPFPRRVTARRTDQTSHADELERIYTIESIATGIAVAAERFTLNTMDLPVNTAVVDYRISRIIGYWDGEALS